MTIKVFWQDPYLTHLSATIKTVMQNQIILYETIFFAFSGGQESDHGTIGGYQVLKAEKKDKEILYTLPNDHNLEPQNTVQIIIDWDRRYKLMKLHFAAEIILELIYRKYPKIEKVGAHIAEHKARIDFKCPHKLTDDIANLKFEAQSIIDQHLNIKCDFSDVLNERRYWEITGFSRVPCGGTHVRNTREIGRVELKRNNPGKGLERIEITILN